MRYLILGATGTLGRATIKALLKDDSASAITCLSRDELKQVELKKEFPDVRIECVIGDIRDRQSIEEHFDGVDVVFHFAALKRIPEMESHPLESLKTNVLGTINAAECAIRTRVKQFIFSSTDKACRPINTYGASKFLSEQILFNYNKKGTTNFSIYRWGNVFGSRGSVIHDFKKSLEERGEVSLTHPDMTRFWIKIDDAVKFMLSTYPEIRFSPKVPQMKSAPVIDLARVIAGEKAHSVNLIGLRPGEKIHEDIECFANGYTKNSYNSERFTTEELLTLIGEVL
jgi:UDP-N-acetylglucosamine 4,6-dehydratase/5-epimerase